MAVHDLSTQQLAIVAKCLRAAADGPFFPEWEFKTLIGVTRVDLRRLAINWELGVANGEDIVAVVNALNALVGYPHGEEEAWSSFIDADPSLVSAVIDTIRA